MNVTQYYENICKKCDLPKFSNFDMEFDISGLEERYGPNIAQKIIEKTDKFRKIIEEFINIDGSNLAALNEINHLNEADRSKLNIIHKELVLIEKEFLLAELDNSEDTFIKFIENSIKNWESIKPELIVILNKARNAWEKELKVTEKLKYFG